MSTAAGEARRHRLLLDPGTRVTCPHCEHEFGLEEGFARRSLEALARAHAAAGRRKQAADHLVLARRASDRLTDEETKRLLLADLETIPA